MDVSQTDPESIDGRRHALSGRRPSLRVSVGAVIVLVLVAAAAAVIVAAVTPRGVETQATPPAVVHTESGTDDGSARSAASGADTTTVYIDVTGAVAAPGLYRLNAGQRVVDAIAAAGGFSAGADQAAVNLARPVEDGEQIIVPQRGAAAPIAGAVAGSGVGGKVDLNTADEPTLETLDGVGPALAARILAYRKAHGSFRTVKDLLNVAGIGDKKFAAMKDSVST